jgi:putative endonuclease
MLYTVYILYSRKFNKHYTGVTTNLQQRIESHNIFGKDWSAKYRPWKLIFSKIFESRKDAFAFELWLKTGVGRDYVKTLPH